VGRGRGAKFLHKNIFPSSYQSRKKMINQKNRVNVVAISLCCVHFFHSHFSISDENPLIPSKRILINFTSSFLLFLREHASTLYISFTQLATLRLWLHFLIFHQDTYCEFSFSISFTFLLLFFCYFGRINNLSIAYFFCIYFNIFLPSVHNTTQKFRYHTYW
jgi:hypothetical protein